MSSEEITQPPNVRASPSPVSNDDDHDFDETPCHGGSFAFDSNVLLSDTNFPNAPPNSWTVLPSSIWSRGVDEANNIPSLRETVERLNIEASDDAASHHPTNSNDNNSYYLSGSDSSSNSSATIPSSAVERMVMNAIFRSSMAMKTAAKSVTAYFETRMLLDRTRFCQELILRSAAQHAQYQKESSLVEATPEKSLSIISTTNNSVTTSSKNDLSDYCCALSIKVQLSFNDDLRRDWYWYRVSVPLDDLCRYVEAHLPEELPSPSSSSSTSSSAAVDFLASADQVSSRLRELLFVPRDGKPRLTCSVSGSTTVASSTSTTATDQSPQIGEVPMFGDSLACTGYCYVEHSKSNKGVHENAQCFDVGTVVKLELEFYNFYKLSQHQQPQREEEMVEEGQQSSSTQNPTRGKSHANNRNCGQRLIDASSESRLFPSLLLRAFPFEFSRSAGFKISTAASAAGATSSSSSSSSTSPPPLNSTTAHSSPSLSCPPNRNHRILRRASVDEIRRSHVLKEKASRDFVLLTTEFQGYLNGSGGPQTQREREDRKKIVFDPNFVTDQIADLVTRFFPPLELWSNEFRKLYGLLDHTSGNSSLTTIMHSKKLPYAHRQKIKDNVVRSRAMNLPILAETLRQITFLRCDYQADGKLLRVAYKFACVEGAGVPSVAAVHHHTSRPASTAPAPSDAAPARATISLSSMVAPYAVSAGYHVDLTKITPVLLSFLSYQFGCSVILYNPYFYIERANCGATTAEQHPPLLLNPLADALYHQYSQGAFQANIEKQELQQKDGKMMTVEETFS